MSILHPLLAIGLVGLLLPATVAAADITEPDVIQESWQCGSKIDIIPSVTDRFSPSHVFEKADRLPTFMAGEIRDPSGLKFSAVFVDTEPGWRGYAVEGQASFFNAYAERSGGRAVLFSMISAGGPGQTYTVFSTKDGFETVACGELSKPDANLSTIDYMQIKTFDIDEGGKGRLTGFVRFSEERVPECFEATTDDGGTHWSKPKRIQPCIDNAFQELDQVPEEAGPLQSLRMYSSN